MNSGDATVIGDRLRAARRESGCTQKEAAAECHVSRQAVSAWERGESAPTVRELMALALLYGASTDFLLFGVKTVPDSRAHVVQQILAGAPARPDLPRAPKLTEV